MKSDIIFFLTITKDKSRMSSTRRASFSNPKLGGVNTLHRIGRLQGETVLFSAAGVNVKSILKQSKMCGVLI